MEAPDVLARTSNGAAQFPNTGSQALDLFYNVGGLRSRMTDPAVLKSQAMDLLSKAVQENAQVAAQLAFHTRAVRDGIGERLTGQTMITSLFEQEPAFATVANVRAYGEYGYWKDVVVLANDYFDDTLGATACTALASAIRDGDRLAAKWAPRQNSQYRRVAKRLARELSLTNAEYRKLLKEQSETLETAMCRGEWSDIDYGKLPSVAGMRYRKAFAKRDTERYKVFLEDKATRVNSGVLFPNEILAPILRHYAGEAMYMGREPVPSEETLLATRKYWDSQPDHFDSKGERPLIMADVSGSMWGDMGKNAPITVCAALALYCSERMEGAFKNKVLTFAGNTELVTLNADQPIEERLREVMTLNWGGSTDFELAYTTVLRTAVALGIPQDEMPTMLVCISDMQFDTARGAHRSLWSYMHPEEQTPSPFHMERIKERFAQAGYTAPKLVFWNVASAMNGTPATSDSPDVALVSGFTPRIMKAVMEADDFDPMSIMFEALEGISIDFDMLTNGPDVALANRIQARRQARYPATALVANESYRMG